VKKPPHWLVLVVVLVLDLDDTWVWNGTNWFNRSPVTRPSPRAIRQGMAYDNQRQEVILFTTREWP
jgi:hypothetical protein